MSGFVYILSNKCRTTLYIGVTSNIQRRLYEHKNELVDGFTKTYHVHDLVYVEGHNRIEDAIIREKQLKRWSRRKKEDLISQSNPTWKDLSQEWN